MDLRAGTAKVHLRLPPVCDIQAISGRRRSAPHSTRSAITCSVEFESGFRPPVQLRRKRFAYIAQMGRRSVDIRCPTLRLPGVAFTSRPFNAWISQFY